jgi:hypothetical protein
VVVVVKLVKVVVVQRLPKRDPNDDGDDSGSSYIVQLLYYYCYQKERGVEKLEGFRVLNLKQNSSFDEEDGTFQMYHRSILLLVGGGGC